MNNISSQEAHPWKAAARTAVAAAGPTLLTLAAVLQAFAQTYDGVLPAKVILWATGAAAFLILSASFISRIMAISGVNEFLSKFNLDAKAPETEVTTSEYKPLVEIPDYPNK